MEKISVSIRVRPLDKQEAAKSLWKINGNTITLCNASGGPSTNQSFVFDNVFGMESTTFDIYKATTQDIVASAVKGFNGTVFAYGQTSSGKTFTMRGTQDAPGIIPLAVHDVFKNLEKAVDREFLLRMSYMEIYNEDINDLLAPEQTKLQVHESLDRGIFVAGLREEIVANPEQVLQLTEFGEAHRHVGETNMNVHSSRSHTIFRMVIESRDKSQDDSDGFSCDAVRVSVLNLVDLAGSERVAKTGAEGARLKEGTHINKSLMVLGTVINKLSEGIQNQGGHVPYRDSKLTRILQPALGGNARTAIICNITPAVVHVDESRGTLQFASRAIRVTNCAQVNEILTDAALLKRQKKEIEELRSKLKESHSEHLEEEILTLRNTLLKSECERERIALELQEEKRAHAERERRQAQKIENLSTLVLNSAVEDREFEKRSKKNARRETWCPSITSGSILDKEANKVTKEDKWISQSRDWTSLMPPPFESLLEEEESSYDKEHGECQQASLQRHQEEHTMLEEVGDREYGSLPDRSARIHVADRKRKHIRERHSDGFQEKMDLLTREANGNMFQATHNIQLSPLVSEVDGTNTMASELSNLEGSRSCQMNTDGCIIEEGDIKANDDTIQVQSADLIIQQLREELDEAKGKTGRMKDQLDSALEELRQLKKESDGSINNGPEELRGLIDSLKKENEELAVQLTEAYMQFEEEKAAWAAAQRRCKEDESRELSMTDGDENAAEMKINDSERFRERVNELESFIVSLKLDKEENVQELGLLLSRSSELQKEVDAANMIADQARKEREEKALEVLAMHERMDELQMELLRERNLREEKASEVLAMQERMHELQTDLLQERGLRETESQELLRFKEDLSSTQELFGLYKAESTKERWMLKTEVLKLQFCLDAMSAKSEVFLGRLLEVRDELKDAYEELDHLKGLKRKQSAEGPFLAEALKTEKRDFSMPDAAHEKLEKEGCYEADAVTATSTKHLNTNGQAKFCQPPQTESTSLEKRKTEPILKENLDFGVHGSQVEEMKISAANLAQTVCIPIKSTSTKQQEPSGAIAVASGQSRRRLTTLNGNAALTSRVTGEVVSLLALSKAGPMSNSDTGHHAVVKPPKPVPCQRNSIRSKSFTWNKENR